MPRREPPRPRPRPAPAPAPVPCHRLAVVVVVVVPAAAAASLARLFSRLLSSKSRLLSDDIRSVYVRNVGLPPAARNARAAAAVSAALPALAPCLTRRSTAVADGRTPSSRASRRRPFAWKSIPAAHRASRRRPRRTLST